MCIIVKISVDMKKLDNKMNILGENDALLVVGKK